ncbi:MAG: CehA/McbA family metallohydrolase [Patescibacteria group bacterium]|nr:CehA/McbA family metallohydrolase [Patescibacteria group bacterium]
MDYKKIRRAANLSKADLHIHSNYSDGKPTIEEILDYVDKETDLDIIAISDHDTIEGALEAQKIAKERKLGFEIVVGEEVSTTKGHILALYLNSVIKPGMSVKKTLDQIHKQGGIAIAPHPFEHTRLRNPNMAVMNGIGLKSLVQAKKDLDTIEIVNGTPTLSDENIKAKLVNSTVLLCGETGSSDAHILDAIGKGYTLFEGKSSTDLKKALESHQTRAMSSRWTVMALLKYLYFFIPIGLRLAVYTLFRGRAKKEPIL